MANQPPGKIPVFQRLLYGGDYNPEQWMYDPDVWQQDMRLMRLANVNTVSIGIFSWAALEPEEGKYTFDWLDRIIDKLSANGQSIILATPSGGKPNWLAAQYPEVCRVNQQGLRDPQRGRHNHCLTAPIYRKKVAEMNENLARRYGKHPALLMWHIGNEFTGYCYCDLCMAAFRNWLLRKYCTLEKLNLGWWATFWSHQFTAWDQVTFIDPSIHGMVLDWRRFMTDQVIDFIAAEYAPLRRLAPHIPITTNFIGLIDFDEAYDYSRIAKNLDIASWDSYPFWHNCPASEGGDASVACDTAFVHDLTRAMKPDRPWMLMETSPSAQNWTPVSRLRRPGMLRLNGLQAIAHGSDSVLYFQWRKSRGGCEKFHGAIVDHVGHESTRVFSDVSLLGAELRQLSSVAGSVIHSRVAVVYDWENRWAIDAALGPRNISKDYLPTCQAHYRELWRRGIAVDVISSIASLGRYKMVIAPMLYMLRPGVAENIAAFVQAGGIFVATYMTGIADENDLCFLGGFPGPLKDVLGIWVEETDVLNDFDRQTIVAGPNELGLYGNYVVRHYVDLLHLRGAQALAYYGNEFVAGTAAVTRNIYGRGIAYYAASRNDGRFLSDFLGGIIREAGLTAANGLPAAQPLPDGISMQLRTDGQTDTLFVLNFSDSASLTPIGPGFQDAYGKLVSNLVTIPGYTAAIFFRTHAGTDLQCLK